MNSAKHLVMAAAALLAFFGGFTFAEEEPTPSAKHTAVKPNKAAKAAAKMPDVGKERAAELLTFVREHHPELAELLEQLQSMKTSEYQAALKDLDRDVRRLEQHRKKAPQRYESELALWKSRSRIRLLSARLSVSEDDDVRLRLKEELREMRRHELAALQLEMESVKQNLEKQRRRLEHLEKQTADLQSSDEEWIEKRLAALEEENQKKNSKRKKPAKAKAKSKPSPTVNADAK